MLLPVGAGWSLEWFSTFNLLHFREDMHPMRAAYHFQIRPTTPSREEFPMPERGCQKCRLLSGNVFTLFHRFSETTSHLRWRQLRSSELSATYQDTSGVTKLAELRAGERIYQSREKRFPSTLFSIRCASSRPPPERYMTPLRLDLRIKPSE